MINWTEVIQLHASSGLPAHVIAERLGVPMNEVGKVIYEYLAGVRAQEDAEKLKYLPDYRVEIIHVECGSSLKMAA